ncbi:putative Chloride channel, voltage gated domain protein [Bordetella bronchiseptica]|nr:putative Chloride channel, voltage gated domain protein [Bordetella bronchiseptica]
MPLTTLHTSVHHSMSCASAWPANVPRYGLLPAIATTRKPAASTPISTKRCQRSTVPRPSSSMAKITPASGALKAAASPPAAPAAISSWL